MIQQKVAYLNATFRLPLYELDLLTAGTYHEFHFVCRNIEFLVRSLLFGITFDKNLLLWQRFAILQK